VDRVVPVSVDRVVPERGSAAEFDVATPRGTARVVVERPAGRVVGLLVLGHGAGGGVAAPDLLAARAAALGEHFVVARVTQPYRLLGRKAPPAPAALDEAWMAVVTVVRESEGRRIPLVVGGRSSGARVACRTAVALGAAGVLALAFPLHPPGKPEKSRLAELDPAVPTLVVNGDRDPFGVPEPAGLVRVEVRAGEKHDLRKDPGGLVQVVAGWLRDLT
jgi:predicted alpha/beta-hydrolase family hydrolase